MIDGQVTVYAEKESGEVLENVDNVHWVYGRKISEQNIAEHGEKKNNWKYFATLRNLFQNIPSESIGNRRQVEKFYSAMNIVNVMIGSWNHFLPWKHFEQLTGEIRSHLVTFVNNFCFL